MKRVLFVLFLIIILVSLNWFVRVLAQDISSLSAEQRAELLRQYQQYQQHQPGGAAISEAPGTYRSADIYDSIPMAKGPSNRPAPDSVRGISRPETGLFAPEPGTRLTSFSALRPFGLELFEGPREASPPDDIAASRDYILGPGDNIIVYLWGRTEQEYNLTVDREGRVFIPKLGAVPAWGRSVDDFQSYLKKKFQTIYTEFDLTVSLGGIRSIRIYLTGEVQRPGAYTVSSLTSLFNALYLAGGPTATGSMRDIRLMRSGTLVASVDLYRFLLEGDNSSDVRLQSGDAIFVPVAGPRVAIRGEVRREAVYELRGAETARDLLELAGGGTAQAHLERVMLEQITDDGEWEVVDVNLSEGDSTGAVMPLSDGDRLTVYSIFENKKNMVAIFGHVKHAGYYERTDSSRVSDLIGRGQLQPYDVYFDRANLFRRYSDWRTEVIPINIGDVLRGVEGADITLQDHDSLHVYSIQEVTWDKFVYVDGEVANPGKYPLYENMTVQDLIFLAGSYTRSASTLQAELASLDRDGQVSLKYVSLRDGVASTTYLEQDDRLYIRRIPEWKRNRTVVISGDVMYPGEYVLADRTESLYQLLQRAGGFTENAFPNGTVLERPTIDESLSRLRVPDLLEKSNPLVQDSLGNVHREIVFDYEPESINRIIVDMQSILESRGRIGDVVLEPGDHVTVPSIPSGISVMGAVGSNGTIGFVPDKTVKHYIRRAGNFTKQADKDNTRLIRANGEVIAGGALGKRVKLGDVIVVPTKIDRGRDWFGTLTTAVTATTGILTTALLIGKL